MEQPIPDMAGTEDVMEIAVRRHRREVLTDSTESATTLSAWLDRMDDAGRWHDVQYEDLNTAARVWAREAGQSKDEV